MNGAETTTDAKIAEGLSPKHASTSSRENRVEHACVADTSTSAASSSKLNGQPAVPEGWRHVLIKQFRHEATKALHLQLDCGLYGRDWRVVYGGSSIQDWGPTVMLVLRSAIFITHLTATIFWKFYRSMAAFTTWTNLVALALFFTSTLLSIAAIGSLSKERRIQEESVGATGRHCSWFGRAEAQYMQLMGKKVDGNPMQEHITGANFPPLRKCFAFRRPLSGSARMVTLEALLTSNDIVVVLALPMVAIMFVVYWTMLFAHREDDELWKAVYNHVFSPVASWLLATLSRFPYRLSLVPVVIAAGLVYVIVIVTLQSFGTGFVYWFLNFIEKPGLAIGISLGLLLVCAPLVSCVAWVVMHRKTAAVDPAPQYKASC